MRSLVLVCVLLSTAAVAQNQPLVLDEVPVPAGNPLTESKRILGKILFWEEQLSTDNSVACGTCHKPGAGGADDRIAVHPGPDLKFNTGNEVLGSPGTPLYGADRQPLKQPNFGYAPQVTRRASQSVLTAMYAESLFWDGRAGQRLVDPLSGEVVLESSAALESQALIPILSSVEMGHINRTWQQVTNKLQTSVPMALARNLPNDMVNALQGGIDYPGLFEQAFGDGAITPVRIAMAIATYERTLLPDQAPFDEYVQGNTSAMTADQIAGWELFRNSVCSQCHVPPLFTNNSFSRTGLKSRFDDNGHQVVTRDEKDFGFFKVPSLRNVGLRKALTHVGWIADVRDAIDFYNAGTHDTGHSIYPNGLSTVSDPDNPGQAIRINQIDFFGDEPDKQAQVADFLANALTDPRAANETWPFDRPVLGSEAATSLAVGTIFGGFATQAIVNGLLTTGAIFTRTDRISINQSIRVAPADAGNPGALYVVIVHNGRYYLRDGEGRFKPWSGNTTDLLPVAERVALGGTELVSVVENLSGLAGRFLIFTGYSTGGRLVYSRSPYRFTVD